MLADIELSVQQRLQVCELILRYDLFLLSVYNLVLLECKSRVLSLACRWLMRQSLALNAMCK